MQIPPHHFFSSRTHPSTLDVLTRGPLAPHLPAYAQKLHDDGYATQSGQLQLRMLGHFNRWLERQRLAVHEVDASTLERYVRTRRKAGKLRRGDPAALSRLLEMLRRDDVERPSPPTASQLVLGQFQHYLRQERSLSEATITHYTPIVAAFLAECLPTGILDFRRIAASDIAGFIQRQADRITRPNTPRRW